MENDFCPTVKKCPLFNGNVLHKESSEESYKSLYCKAGKDRWSICMRYKVATKVGKCAEWVLPNCSLQLDEIISKMEGK